MNLINNTINCIAVKEAFSTGKLLRDGGFAENKLVMEYTASQPLTLRLTAFCGEAEVYSESEYTLTPGLNELLFYGKQLGEDTSLTVKLRCNVGEAELSFTAHPVTIKSVHIIQLSHHDPGYTDIPSAVVEESAVWIDNALTQLEERRDYPDDSKPRIVIEQAWSALSFLKHASPERRELFFEALRNGDIELTALYANLITELLSHEELIEALLPAAELAKAAGVELFTAEHNDITGFTAGLGTALTNAGIKFVVPGLPGYYSWGAEGMFSFWDQEKVFGHTGPGAFWWENDDGSRILFWCNNEGCGGSSKGDLTPLDDELKKLYGLDWHGEVMRLTVQGAARDNSPYVPGYADASLEWNKKYLLPKVRISTEKDFYADFIAHNDVELPVLHGCMNGQDYPCGAMTQAETTALARETHSILTQAELLHALASDDKALASANKLIQKAWNDVLLADEHAYGYHFPASPAQRASWWEHGVYATRANANAQAVLAKSMASIADRTSGEGFKLVVFNTTPVKGSFAVTAPMRSLDQAGSEIRPSNADPRALKGYLLNNRWNTNPQGELLKGCFRLVHNGKDCPFDLIKLSPDSTEELAPERCGLADGTRRMGFFENPEGIGLNLHFTAEDMEPYSFRVYNLVPCEGNTLKNEVATDNTIENEFYRITCDSKGVTAVMDLTTGKQLLDCADGERLGSIYVRNANTLLPDGAEYTEIYTEMGNTYTALNLKGKAPGYYRLWLRLVLTKGVDNVDIRLRAVKSTEPMQTAFIGFPLTGTGLTYDSVLSTEHPGVEILPGVQNDIICAGNFLQSNAGVLLSSASLPVCSMSHLWKGYISPAHRCKSDLSLHPPLEAKDFDTAKVYIMLACNNFGTNFFTSQSYDTVFRFTLAADRSGDLSAAKRWGEAAMSKLPAILTDRSRGTLTGDRQLVNTQDFELMLLRRQENGFLLRLRNNSPVERTLAPYTVLPGIKLTNIELCNAVGRVIGEVGDTLTVKPFGIVTLQLTE